MLVQYLIYLKQLVQGDFGIFITFTSPGNQRFEGIFSGDLRINVVQRADCACHCHPVRSDFGDHERSLARPHQPPHCPQRRCYAIVLAGSYVVNGVLCAFGDFAGGGRISTNMTAPNHYNGLIYS